jgi:hypothetical protein
LIIIHRSARALALLFASSAAVARADVVLGPAALAALVRDASGNPVAGAHVTAVGPAERDATTGVGGAVTLQAMPFGVYAVHVTRSGYQPLDATVRLVSASAPATIVMMLTPQSFTGVGNDVATLTSFGAPLAGGADPFAAHAVAAAAGAQVVATTSNAGSGIAIDGATPAESRVELDGIPLAGGAQGFSAVRFRDALPLGDVAVERGPLTDVTTVRDTIGGIVAYRTPDFTSGLSGGLAAGYDSAFGAFQHARFADTFGPLGVSLDAVTGDGENRAQTLKAQYALSSDVSLGIASYGSQSQSTTAAGNALSSNAPAFAAYARASLGTGTLLVRSFTSSAQTNADEAVPLENAALDGFQAAYDLPSGNNLFGISFDRRTEANVFGDGSTSVQQFHTYTVRGDVALAARDRVEFADSFESGTTFAQRSDPRLAFAYHASDRVTLRLAAGSAFSTEPANAFATAALADASRAPETSFGTRLRVDAKVGSGVSVWGSAFETRRFDRPAGLPDAHTAGLEAGIARPAPVAGFGVNAYLDLQHGIAPAPGAFAYDNDPASKARVALDYRLRGFALDFGTTLQGANNAFAPRAVVLGDVGLHVPFARLADVRFGIENLYGTTTAYPTLAPLFYPREFTLTVGRSPNFTP